MTFDDGNPFDLKNPSHVAAVPGIADRINKAAKDLQEELGAWAQKHGPVVYKLTRLSEPGIRPAYFEANVSLEENYLAERDYHAIVKDIHNQDDLFLDGGSPTDLDILRRIGLQPNGAQLHAFNDDLVAHYSALIAEKTYGVSVLMEFKEEHDLDFDISMGASSCQITSNDDKAITLLKLAYA